YTVIKENAPTIRSAGFTWVWFPPPSDSPTNEGYLPRKWNLLTSHYGTDAQLKDAIKALGRVQAMADVVVNHRVGVATGGVDFEEPRFPDWEKAVTSDDDSGKGKGAADTGEKSKAARDLDHTNTGVRDAIKAYLTTLQTAGFKGWRYDMVKGYHGK